MLSSRQSVGVRVFIVVVGDGVEVEVRVFVVVVGDDVGGDASQSPGSKLMTDTACPLLPWSISSSSLHCSVMGSNSRISAVT